MINIYDQFCEIAGLDSEVMKEKRRTGKIYGTFIIAHAEGWLNGFDGIEFLAEIIFTKNAAGKRKIKEVVPVRITERYIIRGRAINSEAVVMI